MNAAQPIARVSSRGTGSTLEADLNLEQCDRALARLYQLLEDYAPSWYTREDRESARAALQALHRHLNLPEVT
ncbi:MAG TPA: hypothetical protein VMG82_06685 [Candidatus Sulfotelmatobacter sp.]|nr:hypothetical protein [Candidatus Sulfotelmatobacter sp.]